MEIKLTDEQLQELIQNEKFAKELASEIARQLTRDKFFNNNFTAFAENLRIELAKLLKEEDLLLEIKRVAVADVKYAIKSNLSALLNSILH